MFDLEFDEEQHVDEFRTGSGEWIECGKCRAIMFDTFKSCWSCGVSLTGKNKVPVRF
jgi:hypothetical protein